jgi:hypothetical protein
MYLISHPHTQHTNTPINVQIRTNRRSNEYLRQNLKERVAQHMAEITSLRANSNFISSNKRDVIHNKDQLEKKEEEKKRMREELDRAMAARKEALEKE